MTTETKVEPLVEGKRARVLHCDMGVMDVVVKQFVGEKFHTCTVLAIHHKNARHPGTAKTMDRFVKEGRSVDVFIQPHELIEYLN